MTEVFVSYARTDRGAALPIIEAIDQAGLGAHLSNRSDANSNALLADIDTGGAKDALPLLAFTLERLGIKSNIANFRIKRTPRHGKGDALLQSGS